MSGSQILPSSCEKAEFETIYQELVLAFARTEQDVEVAKLKAPVYFKNLSDIPVVSLRKGFDRCIKRCRFFPTIAVIRSASGHWQSYFSLSTQQTERRWDETADSWGPSDE